MAMTQYTKQVWKGSVITSPLPPTLVTCRDGEKENVFTVAWTGILNTQPPITYISVRPERYSYAMIANSGEFVINLATQELVRAVDLCGVKSGRNLDKFELTGLTTEKASKVCLGTHDMFIADIVALDIANELIDDKGRLALEKAGLIAYSHGEYFELGRKLGTFGYSVRKKKKKSSKKG